MGNISSNSKGMYKGKSHAEGGIPVVVDGNTNVEIEGNEYHLCRDAMSSAKIYSFKNKSNKEILDSIYSSEGCKFVQGIANSGDFIVCKLVVLDDAKRTIIGTVKSIIDTMQSEKSCNVSEGGNKMEKGGGIEGLELIDKTDEFGEKYDVIVNGTKQGFISKSDEQYFVMSNSAKGGKPFPSKFFNDLEKAKKYVYSKTKNIITLNSKNVFKQLGYEQGGSIDEHKETYEKWKSLVNMSKSELKEFYDSQEGKDAGLSDKESNDLGISNGRESARWIMRMKDTPVSEWTPKMWEWANKQISFISRMSGNKGGLYDDKGNKTRKHTSLLIWGHNPKKMEMGGGIEFVPEKKGTLIRGNEIIKYAEKVNGNYRLVFYKIKESNGKVPILCDAFDYCHKLDTNEVSADELIELIKKNNLMEEGGEIKDLIVSKKVELNFYRTTPDHALEYGVEAKNPLYLKNFHVTKTERLKGIGKKMLKYLDDYAIENGNDVIFGHINQKATFTKNKETIFNDTQLIKNWLHDNGYAVNDDNNDFHKVVGTKMKDGGNVITYRNKFNKKYGFDLNESHSLEEIAKLTSLKLSALQDIYNKGIGAYKTNPESVRPNVKSKEQWAMARVYSAVMGGKASKVDANELKRGKMEKGGAIDNFKMVSFPEDKNYKYYVVDEDEDNYLTVQEDMYDKWKNANKIERAEYYSEWIPKEDMVETMEDGGEVSDRISQIDKEKLTILNEVDSLIREHKKLYRNIDIAMPKSDAEKQSDKKIANLLSRANELVMEKRNLISKSNKMEQGGNIELKQKQLEIINSTNPAPNEYNTWIRTIKDIKTAEEVFSIAFAEGAMYPDFQTDDMTKAIESGYVTIFSSYPIKEGVFVTTSKMNAQEYAGGKNGKVFSKKVHLKDIAWIDEGEGQYAPIESLAKGGNIPNSNIELLAPNGKKSNLTSKQWHIVRTPAFKQWFGDWEKLEMAKIKDSAMDEVTLANISKEVSKVVDENGEPLVVYHFTDKKFSVFKQKGLSKGYFFTENKKDDEFSYNNNPKSYFLSIKKMSEVSEVPNRYWSTPYYENEFIDKSKKGGSNGIRFVREIDNKRIIVAFYSNQIKLADGTNTTFDSNNDDIRYEDGGSIKTALNDIEKAPSVKYWMEPEFIAESYKYEQKGKPDSFVKLFDKETNADTILAYNKRGNLVGLLTISKGGEEQGAFKIVVREDFMNKGWGKKLLDEAEKQGIDIVGNIKHNSFSFSGRNLLRSWLGNKIGNKMEDGGEIENLDWTSFDWDSVYNPSDEEKQRIDQEIKESQKKEKEDWYQKSKYKRYSETYEGSINKAVKSYLDAKEMYEDWSTRQYKSNKGIVYAGGDDIHGDAYSIGGINENRKRNRIMGAKMEMDESIELLKDLGLSNEEISNLTQTNKMENLFTSMMANGGEIGNHENLESQIMKQQFGK